MTRDRCIVSSCRVNHEDEGVKLVGFPKKGSEKYNKWLAHIPAEDHIKIRSRKRPNICSRHFVSSCFGWKSIKTEAVPTLHLEPLRSYFEKFKCQRPIRTYERMKVKEVPPNPVEKVKVVPPSKPNPVEVNEMVDNWRHRFVNLSEAQRICVKKAIEEIYDEAEYEDIRVVEPPLRTYSRKIKKSKIIVDIEEELPSKKPNLTLDNSQDMCKNGGLLNAESNPEQITILVQIDEKSDVVNSNIPESNKNADIGETDAVKDNSAESFTANMPDRGPQSNLVKMVQGSDILSSDSKFQPTLPKVQVIEKNSELLEPRPYSSGGQIECGIPELRTQSNPIKIEQDYDMYSLDSGPHPTFTKLQDTQENVEPGPYSVKVEPMEQIATSASDLWPQSITVKIEQNCDLFLPGSLPQPTLAQPRDKDKNTELGKTEPYSLKVESKDQMGPDIPLWPQSTEIKIEEDSEMLPPNSEPHPTLAKLPDMHKNPQLQKSGPFLLKVKSIEQILASVSDL